MGQSFRTPHKILRRLKLTPLAARKIKNWPSFMLHYAWGVTPKNPYIFRNGAKIQISRAIDHVPIIEIFLKEDYGAMPSDSIMLDLGANIGVFTVYATTTAKNNRIYAYEPFLEYCNFAESNAKLNHQEHAVKCFPKAVAGVAGDRELFVKGTDFFFPTLVGAAQGKAESITIHCTTLAEIIASNQLTHIDMLKMDCEGAEYEILYSAPEQLRLIKEIRMEYHNLGGKEQNVARLKEFLVAQGFRITHELANSSTNGNLWAVRV